MSSRTTHHDLLLITFALQMKLVPADALVAALTGWLSAKERTVGELLEAQGAIDPATHALLVAAVDRHVALHGDLPPGREPSSAAIRTPSGIEPAAPPVRAGQPPSVRAGQTDPSGAGSAPASVRRGQPDPSTAGTAAPSVRAGQPAQAAGTDPATLVTPGQATLPGAGLPAPGQPCGDAPTWSADPEATVVNAGFRSHPGRFRKLRLHARGGLGEVYVAHDEEVHRDVALKEIQFQEAGSEHNRARFLQEAEITGRLEHPGVVPVYGIGRYPDGRPYYAMRFIRGSTLTDEIERHHREMSKTSERSVCALELSRLLNRFMAACQVIEYAHSRGILHRDIKPGNIMLGRFGETLVVDWGLAKQMGTDETDTGMATLGPIRTMSGSGSAATQMGMAIGTPQYMSPEQAEGRLDKLSAASDVYSLGATLYFLLTGQPPFGKGRADEVMARAASGDFPRPRAVKPTVPRPLEAICLRAMARRPQDRYASPRLLAEDIEAWMNDAPVSAHGESLAERGFRWARRHRALAGAGAFSLAVVAIVSVLALVRVDRSREAERRALEAAMRRFREAREATDQVILGITELRGVPGARKVYRNLLQMAADSYTRFAKDASGDADVRFQAARARSQLGRVRWIAGELDRAQEDFRIAETELSALIRECPTRGDFLLARASTRRGVADMQPDLPESAGSPEKRVALYRQALEDFRQAALRSPDNPDCQKGLAATLIGLGTTLRLAGDADAEKTLRWAVREHEMLIAVNPKDEAASDGRARALGELAVLSETRGDHAAAEKLFTEALAEHRRALKDQALPFFQSRMTTTLRGLTRAALRTGRVKEARRHLDEALATDRALAEADPSSWRHRRALALDHWARAGLEGMESRPVEVEKALQSSVSELAVAIGQSQSVPALHEYMAFSLTNLGNHMGAHGKRDAARTHLARAVDECRVMLASRPADRSGRGALAMCLTNLGLAHLAGGAYADALKCLDEAEKIGAVEATYEGWHMWAGLPGMKVPDAAAVKAARCRALAGLGKTGPGCPPAPGRD